jgi:spore germination protein
MKKKWILPALAGILTIAGMVYWGYGLNKDKKQLVTYLNNRNQRAFYEMVGHVENVENMLSKGIVSSSPTQRMMLFADIWQQAYAAQENLTQIPMTGPSMTRTSRFLNQTGDFTWSLAKNFARGLAVKPDDMTKLNKLHTEAGFLAAELQKIERSAADGRLTWGEIQGAADKKLKQATLLPAGLQKLDKSMEEFPTLIYDGPFSDHIVNRKPRGLTGIEINRNKASEIAKNFVETGSENMFKVSKTENVNGTIPAFRIYLNY